MSPGGHEPTHFRLPPSQLWAGVRLQNCLREEPGARRGTGRWGFELKLTQITAVQGANSHAPLAVCISMPVSAEQPD